MRHSHTGPRSRLYEDAFLLDADCEACRGLTVGDLDDDHLRALLGMTRQQLETWIDPARAGGTGDWSSRGPLSEAVALLWTFRHAIRDSNAIQVGLEVRALVRAGRWPMSSFPPVLPAWP